MKSNVLFHNKRYNLNKMEQSFRQNQTSDTVEKQKFKIPAYIVVLIFFITGLYLGYFLKPDTKMAPNITDVYIPGELTPTATLSKKPIPLPTPALFSEIETWKDFTDCNKNINIKYPPNWTYFEEGYEGFACMDIIFGPKSLINAVIKKYYNPFMRTPRSSATTPIALEIGNRDLSEELDRLMHPSDPEPVSVTKNKVLIKDKPAYRYTVEYLSDTTFVKAGNMSTVFIVEKGETVYKFTLFDPKYLDILNTMIFSVSFSDS